MAAVAGFFITPRFRTVRVFVIKWVYLTIQIIPLVTIDTVIFLMTVGAVAFVYISFNSMIFTPCQPVIIRHKIKLLSMTADTNRFFKNAWALATC